MRDIVRLTAADSRRVPWRNGRGVTEELAIWPEGASFAAGDFDGRISKARVTEPGPFSAFQGFDRVLVVTRGSGLRLFHGDSAPSARVACLEPYSFSGDWPTTADLPDGPVADFNVIVRRGRCRADVSVDRIPRFGGSRIGPRAATGDLFAHVLSGEVRARTVPGDDLGALGPGESVWIRDAQQGESLRLLRGRSDGDVVALRAAAAPEEHPAVVLLVWITPV
jgi:environmental stress-induced protein Ves